MKETTGVELSWHEYVREMATCHVGTHIILYLFNLSFSCEGATILVVILGPRKGGLEFFDQLSSKLRNEKTGK